MQTLQIIQQPRKSISVQVKTRRGSPFCRVCCLVQIYSDGLQNDTMGFFIQLSFIVFGVTEAV